MVVTTIKTIFHIIPVPIIKTNRFISDWAGAMSCGIFVLIRPNMMEPPLVEHELTHCRQFYRTFGVFALLYWLSKKYRLKYEVEAYKDQAAMHDDPPLNLYAQWLSSNYGLDITKEKALELLSSN